MEEWILNYYDFLYYDLMCVSQFGVRFQTICCFPLKNRDKKSNSLS